MRVFVALQTFDCPELKSTYVEGLSYSVRPGNRYLNALAEVWALEGKVRFAHNTTKCVVTGIGHVVNTPPPPPAVIQWAPVMEPVIMKDEPVKADIEEVVLTHEEPICLIEPTYWEMTKEAWRRLWR